MIVLFEKKEQCFGCESCYNVCPVNAIKMISDQKGFLYPEIDHKKCIECNICLNSCPIHNTVEKSINQKLYGVKHNTLEVRMKSSSGGAFTALTYLAIDDSYIIYGAEFDKNFEVKHNKYNNVEGRNRLRGSKYVQSRIDNIFSTIYKELKMIKSNLFWNPMSKLRVV